MEQGIGARGLDVRVPLSVVPGIEVGSGIAAFGTAVMQWGWADHFLVVEKMPVAAAVFLWFLVVGGATVVMAGGLTRRPPQPVSAEQPVPAADDEAPEVVTEAVTAPVAVATDDSDEPSEDVAAAEVIEDGDPTPDADVPAAADPMPEPEPDVIPAEFPVGPREPVDLDYLAGLPDAEDMFDADGDLGPGDTPPSGRPDTH